MSNTIRPTVTMPWNILCPVLEYLQKHHFWWPRIRVYADHCECVFEQNHDEFEKCEEVFCAAFNFERTGSSQYKIFSLALLCEDNRKDLLNVGFSSADLHFLESFLEKFCPTARQYLVRMFMKARRKNKSLGEILKVCSDLWEEEWKHGSPDRYGDPDDVTPPNVGMRNTSAILEAYRRLD